MASTRDIVRRIKSVKNTKKITKAMELVAASKMKKAVDAVLATRSYANLSWLTVTNLAQVARHNQPLHNLLNARSTVKKVAVILIGSNRGLCGGYNANVINKAIASVKKHNGDVEHDFILLGKKTNVVHHRFNYNVAADFAKEDVITQVAQAVPVAQFVIEKYLAGEYDKIMLAYTDFISSLRQVPRVKQLLPIEVEKVEEYLGTIGETSSTGGSKDVLDKKQEQYFAGQDYIFEPNPKEVLDDMIPRLLEIQVFQALLEANASEHSSRMLAMRNASDAADEMVDELTLYYNKARQTAITTEISEISAGTAALASK